MNNITITLMTSLLFMTGRGFAADVDICNLKNFTTQELNNPYASIKQPIQKLSERDSQMVVQSIIDNAKEESYSYRRPCLNKTKSCFGEDKDWTYSREIIVDNFGNLLRLNGEAAAKKFSNWPNPYYSHQTSTGFTCSWGGGLKSQCIKWCSLSVIDDRFHD